MPTLARAPDSGRSPGGPPCCASAVVAFIPRVFAVRRRRAGGGAQRLELEADRIDEVVQIRDEIPVGIEAPVETPGVAEERDAEPLLAKERDERVAREHTRAEDVRGERRAGNVGDDDVER